MARCSWARTATPPPHRPSARPWKCSRPMAWTSSSSATTASRRPRSSPTRPWSATAGLKIGVDPLGGAAAGYWGPVREEFGLNITVVNPKLDPTFRFMTLDHDGKIRMDCSSPYAMAGLVKLKDRFDIAFGNDPDSDR